MNQIIKAFSIKKIRYGMLLLLLLLLLTIPIVFSGQTYMLFIVCIVGIYIIVNTGLDVLFGDSGQISLGQAGFYAIGAYLSAILSIRGVPVFLSMLLAAVGSAVIGYLLALPAVKLVHHFLALVTIGFGEIVRLIVLNGGNLTGGTDGLNFVPALSLFGFELRSYQSYVYFVLVSVLIFLFVKCRLVDSRVGRAMVAIRENADASEMFGIELSRYKGLAFTFSAFYAGFGGALYAHLVRFISPESFTSEQSIMFLIIVLIGGMGTFVGPLLGSILLVLLTEFLQRFGNYQMAIYGILIIVVLFVMPKGIVGTIKKLAANYMKHKDSAEGLED